MIASAPWAIGRIRNCFSSIDCDMYVQWLLGPFCAQWRYKNNIRLERQDSEKAQDVHHCSVDRNQTPIFQTYGIIWFQKYLELNWFQCSWTACSTLAGKWKDTWKHGMAPATGLVGQFGTSNFSANPWHMTGLSKSLGAWRSRISHNLQREGVRKG